MKDLSWNKTVSRELGIDEVVLGENMFSYFPCDLCLFDCDHDQKRAMSLPFLIAGMRNYEV